MPEGGRDLTELVDPVIFCVIVQAVVVKAVAFAEFALATPAAYPTNPSLVTDLVWSVGLADAQITLSWLAVTGALMIGAG